MCAASCLARIARSSDCVISMSMARAKRIKDGWPRLHSITSTNTARMAACGSLANTAAMQPVCRCANLYFFDHPDRSGIFNLGTGRAQPFNDVAVSVINTRDAVSNTLEALVAQRKIEYIPFPDTLRGKYQCFTQADLTRLRGAGYSAPFLTVQQGVERYVHWLISQL